MKKASRFSQLEIPAPGGEDAAQGKPAHPLDVGRRCEAEGSFDAALRYYARALAGDGRLEEAWLGQVSCLIGLGEYREAETWADRGLAIVPDSGDLLALKAVAWGRMGDLDRALGFSDSALGKPRATALSWWARGDVLAATDFEAARHCFVKALEQRDLQARILPLVARSWISAGHGSEARSVLLRARAMGVTSAVAEHLMGLACEQLGLLAEAVEAHRRALRLRPRWEEPRRALEALTHSPPLVRAWRRLSGWLGSAQPRADAP